MLRRISVAIAGVAALACPAAASGTVQIPQFSPGDFAPGNVVYNPYFPLLPGTVYTYRGRKDGKPAGDVLEVTHERAQVGGVDATVVHDRGFTSGKLTENTVDWYAQDKSGNVWYLGEETETLRPNGQVESTEGSWKTGVNGAKPGIFMPASPRPHVGFVQEIAPPTAEDQFETLTLNAKVSVPYISTNRALRTKETTPLEKGVVDNKVYALGIGTVLEVTVKGPEERFALVGLKRP
jgi:hypothetical protein